MKLVNGEKTLESMSQAIWYNQWTLEKFRGFLHGDILEVGCGIGNFTKSLTTYGQVFAIDIAEKYIKEIRKMINGNAGFGDIESGKYFFNGKQFDSVVCLNVLEHIRDDKQALKNLYKLLKNEGFLILLVPIHPFLYGKIDQSIGHFRRYREDKLIKSLNDAGFKIVKSRRLNFLGAIGWLVAGRIFKEEKIRKRQIKLFNFFAPLILLFEDLIEPAIGTSILVIAQKEGRQ